MNVMKKVFALACMAVFAAVGCQEEAFEGRPDTDNYYASVESFGSDTRTALQEGSKVVWSSEDRIAIFEGNGAGQAYQVLDAYVGKSSGEFAPVEGLMTGGTAEALDGTVAVYPFDESITVAAGAEGTYTISGIEFPSEQHHAAGTFSEESFPMAGLSASGSRNLSFRNIGGVIRLSLTGDYSVSRITLKGNSGEPLSGSATVTLGQDGIPSVTMSDDASTSVSLLCDPAVQLDPETATEFYISIPPTQFKVGFKVTILDEDGKEHGVATHKDNSVKRSTILAMPETTPENLDDIELTADMFCSVDFIEGWTETRFGGDGTMVFVKEDEQGRMTHTLMFLPDEENILMPVYIRYDENEIPSYMSFMDTEIYIDGYTDSTIDFTLAVKDAVWSVKDVPCSELVPYSLQTRAWADNNGIRNACAIGNCIVGLVDLGVGLVMISGAVVAEGGSVGLATPAAVPTIAAGLVQIGAGCISINDGFSTIFGPADQKRDPYIADMIIDSSLEGLAEFLENIEVKENPIIQNFPKEIIKEAKLYKKVGLASFTIGLGLTWIDGNWGETYTKEHRLAQVHNNIEVNTGSADNITSTSAELHGYVSPLATRPLGEKIYSSISILVWGSIIADRAISNSDGGDVSFVFDNLIPERTYKYQIRFYDATNDITRYGEVKEFKTKEEPDERWVDLGLSVLWAAYNVGASSPEEYGGYYAWGETSTKSDYTFENYKYREKDYYSGDYWTWTGKFIGNEISGTSYDVAHVTWGDGARMPTHTEVMELVDNCTFTGGSYNGVSGNYVTGPNGNSIFLPFAGIRGYGYHEFEGRGGSFWSGTYEDGTEGVNAYCFGCGEDYGEAEGDWGYGPRCLGLSVRSVTDK